MPLISVIVPVYKVEAYLDRCVESILCQTFRNFELILVDDGSPDNCGAMCDAWAQKDERIHVIHKKNGGLSDARNAGMDWCYENSKSEWLTFIDSDDYVHPKMLEALLDAAKNNNVKISVCGYAETCGEKLPESEIVCRTLSVRDLYREHNINATVAWAKLVHKELYEGIRFPVGKLHEDAFTTYKVIFQCEEAAYLDWKGYAYLYNCGSLTKRPWSKARLDLLEAIQGQIEFFNQRGETELKQMLIRNYMKALMWQLAQVSELEDANNAIEGEKVLISLGRSILRKYRKDKVFTGEKDMWIFARFYPKATKIQIFCTAVYRKILGKQ